LRLGRNTANGWGTFDWSPETPQRLDTDAVRKWVAAKDRKAGWSALEPLDQASMTTVKAATDRIQQPSSATRITIRLTLHFDGPLLVREGGAKPPAGSEAPIVGRFTTDGRVLLPARSIRGAFRAQGERILRTLAPDLETADKWAPDPTRRDAEEFAATEPRESDDALALRLHSLPLAARIFGVGGWRSAVEFSDFTTGAGVPVRRLRQQCVAIDRFTGGAADGALFGLEGVWQPILEGTMTLDRSRWARAGVADWGPGLIALVLCDLRDGFLTFGMGASKGYGACRGIWDAKNLNLSSDIERLRASLPRPAAPRFIIT
jgi:CRISPR/Cas system CSM-associated protein Csm3 (group 7 of RAMP superfamily)